METTTAAVIIAMLFFACVAYGLTLLARGRAADRKLEEARMPLEHDERLTQTAANRDIEIAKATKSQPSKLIEGK